MTPLTAASRADLTLTLTLTLHLSLEAHRC